MKKQPVFTSQEGCVYRIPALFYNRDSQTLLAFAEKRRTLSDDTAEKLVMKTAKLKKGDSNEKKIQWSELKEVEEALLNGYRTMNPCPLYDEKSKKLFLFFICVQNGYSEMWQRRCGCNKARLCYITTADDGENWSELTDLTPKLPEIEGWATFAVGPGHGLQTQSGRLIVPVYAYPNKPGSCCCLKGWASTSYALALYSDDPDNKWQFGNMLQTESGECQMAELLDRDKGNRVVYCNARCSSGHRVEAVSGNGGADFSNLTRSEENGKLVDTPSGCQGSLVSFPAQSEVAATMGGPNSNIPWLLFTHTTDVNERVDLGVYLNKQDPDKWSKPWIINRGTSGYADLAYIGKGQFVCLMEGGEMEKTINQISSAKFTYSEVKQGIGE